MVAAATGPGHAQPVSPAPQAESARSPTHAAPAQVAPSRIVLAQTDAAPEKPAAAPPAAETPPEVTETPAVVVDEDVADALLGKAVQSANGDDMGRIVDVIVDRRGAIRAAVIDFGGFLGVGTRKIAVDWRILNFAKAKGADHIVADLSQDRLRKAPPYKPGEPVVIVGRSDAGPSAQHAPAAASAPPPTQAPDPGGPAPANPGQASPSPANSNASQPDSARDAPASNR